jgi:hypothetical protein
MLARFRIAEEVTRSPFGVQTHQNLDSSPFLHGRPPSLFRHGQIDGPPSVALRGIVSEQAHDLPALILRELQELVGAREHGLENRLLAHKWLAKVHGRVVGSD